MNGLGGRRPLIYQSDNIFERRQRVLRVVRKMIAESGVAELSVRELCTRAGIAQKTLYNAFGSKENVITLAIQQYTAEFSQQASYKFAPDTLDGQLERLIKVHSRNTQLRAYTTAIMTVYNSPQASPQVRDTIRAMSFAAHRPFADALSERGSFLPGVTAETFLGTTITTTYSILTDWCFGEVEDHQLVERVCEAYLMALATSTKGKVRAEAESWLSGVRKNGRSWATLRTMAEVDPRELRAAFMRAARAQLKDRHQKTRRATSA